MPTVDNSVPAKRPRPGRPKLPEKEVCREKITIRLPRATLADLRRLSDEKRRIIGKRARRHIARAVELAKAR